MSGRYIIITDTIRILLGGKKKGREIGIKQVPSVFVCHSQMRSVVKISKVVC